MGLTLVTAPASEPITLAEARAHCRIDGGEDDGLVAGYLVAARHYAETYTRRALMTQTWRLTIDDGWPIADKRGRIVLPKAPLRSVTSVTYVDSTGATQTLAADQYKVVPISATGEACIDRAYGVAWPSVRQEADAISVTFACGYGDNPGDVPETIRQAMLLTIGHMYANREAVIVGTIVSDLPLGVDALLFPHRLFY